MGSQMHTCPPEFLSQTYKPREHYSWELVRTVSRLSISALWRKRERTTSAFSCFAASMRGVHPRWVCCHNWTQRWLFRTLFTGSTDDPAFKTICAICATLCCRAIIWRICSSPLLVRKLEVFQQHSLSPFHKWNWYLLLVRGERSLRFSCLESLSKTIPFAPSSVGLF